MRWPFKRRIKPVPEVDTAKLERLAKAVDKQREETDRVVEQRRYYRRTNNYVDDWVTAWVGRRRNP